LFITKSRLLAEKVERDYVSLLYSLSTGPDAPLYVRERKQRWKSRRKKVTFDPDNTEGKREDLPEKFSELGDNDFPLFITIDTVSIILPINDTGTDDGGVCICSCLVFLRPMRNSPQVPPGAENRDPKRKPTNGTDSQTW
jgi:hypothetical protein